MIRNALGRVGSVFSKGISLFNRNIPTIQRGIGEVNKIGRNIGEAAKAVRTIGSSINSISGGRLEPFRERANQIMNKIENVGNEITSAEPVLQQGLNALSRKINA